MMQNMMPGMMPFMPRGPTVPMSNLAPALYVGDLDENIREEALYDLFSKFGQIYFIRLMRDPATGRSRGFAYVNFCNPRDAENAKHVAQYEKLGRKHIRIMYKRPNIKQLNTNANVFIKNIDKAATIKDLHQEMSKFGPILSAKLAVDQKGDSLGYGYVQFEREEDAKKALETLQKGNYQFKETIVEGFEFKARTDRAPKKRNNIYIKHIPDKDEGQIRKEIEQHFSQFGTVDQMAVRKDPRINKWYSFVCFRENEAAEKAVNHFKDTPANPFGDAVPLYVSYAQTRQERDDELRQRKSQSNNQNNLFLKNLKSTVTKEQLKEVFSAFGEVVSCEAKDWNSTQNTKKLKYGFVAFKSVEEAAQARNEAPENAEVKKLFNDDKPYINVFQQRDQRSKFLQTQFRIKQQGGPYYSGFQPNLDMQSSLNNPNRRLPNLFPPYALGPMQGGFGMGPQGMRMGGGYNNPMGNRKPMGPRTGPQGGPDNRVPRGPRGMPGQGPMGQNRSPMGGPIPRGGPQQGGSRNFTPQGQFNMGGAAADQRRPQPQQQQTRASQQPIPGTDPTKMKPSQAAGMGANLSIADLKNKWSDFLKLDKDKQRNILGELLFPLIKERVGENIAPKITGMLIDLDVLEIQDIFEFLEDTDLLDERIKEASELIASEGQ